MTALTANQWSIVAFVLGIAFVCIFMLTVPRLLGNKAKGMATEQPFESGVVGVGGARIRLSAKFYLVSMFFVLFDLEALFLYSWSVSVRETGWAGFVEALVFVVVLVFGLIYIWRVGGLDWAPENSVIKNKAKKAAAAGAPYGGKLNLAQVTQFTSIEDLETDATGKVPAQLSGQVQSARRTQEF